MTPTSGLDAAFARALSAEILVSEQIRVRVLAATLAGLLAMMELLIFVGEVPIRGYPVPLRVWQLE